MSMSQKGSILNRRNALAEALMRAGLDGSQSGAQVGPPHAGPVLSSSAQVHPVNGAEGTQSGAADYNYPEPISSMVETYNRVSGGIPSPSAPEWMYEKRRRGIMGGK